MPQVFVTFGCDYCNSQFVHLKECLMHEKNKHTIASSKATMVTEFELNSDDGINISSAVDNELVEMTHEDYEQKVAEHNPSLADNFDLATSGNEEEMHIEDHLSNLSNLFGGFSHNGAQNGHTKSKPTLAQKINNLKQKLTVNKNAAQYNKSPALNNCDHPSNSVEIDSIQPNEIPQPHYTRPIKRFRPIKPRSNDHNRIITTPSSSKAGHSCPICGKVFERSGALWSHTKTHSFETLQCSECSYTTKFKSNLYRHERSYHGRDDLTKMTRSSTNDASSNAAVTEILKSVAHLTAANKVEDRLTSLSLPQMTNLKQENGAEFLNA